jgi:spermidine synthase
MEMKTENSLRFSIIVLGFSAMITQLVLLREFLTIFYGNELVIGVILANWMLLTGLGALIGGRIKSASFNYYFIIFLQFILAVFPFISVFLLYSLKNIIFPVGIMINIIQVAWSSFLLLAPYCLTSGMLFTIYSVKLSNPNEKAAISNVYSLESFGSILGGLIFTWLLVSVLKTFQILTLIIFINLFTANIVASVLQKLYVKIIILLASIVLLFIPFTRNYDLIITGKLFKDQEICSLEDTPYGKIVITKYYNQYNFFENGILLFATNNEMSNEEAVHYALIQHPEPKQILLISGGISGVTKEILKYPVEQIDYLEINPWLIKTASNYTYALKDKRIVVINKDARLFIKKTKNTYDVALINLPEPSTAGLNRYYTIEFFKELKKKLNKNAIISTSLMSTAEYVSAEAGEVNSVLYNTLKKVFTNVLIIPGLKNYFLASDGPLSTSIAKLITDRKINNLYVNQYYLNDNLLKSRSDFIMKSIRPDARLNLDFIPVNYYNQLNYWLSQYNFKYIYILIFLTVLLVIILFTLSPINLGLFTSGFSASSMQFLILLGFQVYCGYLYKITGLIFAFFMMGLALGAFLIPKIMTSSRKNFLLLQLSMGLYAMILPFIFILMVRWDFPSWLFQLIIFLAAADIGTITGGQFAIATNLIQKETSKIAAISYSTDLLGSAIGLVLVAAILLPLLGFVKVGLIIGAMNLICILILLTTAKKGIKK